VDARERTYRIDRSVYLLVLRLFSMNSRIYSLIYKVTSRIIFWLMAWQILPTIYPFCNVLDVLCISGFLSTRIEQFASLVANELGPHG
jgi:hypothetical protein